AFLKDIKDGKCFAALRELEAHGFNTFHNSNIVGSQFSQKEIVKRGAKGMGQARAQVRSNAVCAKRRDAAYIRSTRKIDEICPDLHTVRGDSRRAAQVKR